jgi:hypothetical protein
VTVPWGYALNTEENHIAAAKELCRKFDRHDRMADNPWMRPFVSGFDYQQNGQHVFTP